MYDALGRAKSQLDVTGKKLSCSYDAAGQLTSLGLPSGQSPDYPHNAIGQLTGMTTPWGSASHKYDDRGPLTELARSNGVETDCSHDVGREGHRGQLGEIRRIDQWRGY